MNTRSKNKLFHYDFSAFYFELNVQHDEKNFLSKEHRYQKKIPRRDLSGIFFGKIIFSLQNDVRHHESDTATADDTD